jgi:DNA-binding NarL/FixJ family response regulator
VVGFRRRRLGPVMAWAFLASRAVSVRPEGPRCAVTVFDGHDMIRILIADDHPMLRDGVAAAIADEPDMVSVGQAGDGIEAIESFSRLRPDVTLMDLQMPGMDGLAAISAIRKIDALAKIIVLTTYPGDVQATRALRAGAAGYLLKGNLRNRLIETIRSVHVGRRVVDADVAQDIALHSPTEALVEREILVLHEIARGRSNKEIARKLGLSEDTIKACMKTIFVKLDVSDRTHAVVTAVRRGVIVL